VCAPPPLTHRLQVAAYCDGRDTVSEFDCLLLEHVLWQLPEHAVKINDWLLSQLAVDDGMKQVGPGCDGVSVSSMQLGILSAQSWLLCRATPTTLLLHPACHFLPVGRCPTFSTACLRARASRLARWPATRRWKQSWRRLRS
jgi:hypothetical protein